MAKNSPAIIASAAQPFTPEPPRSFRPRSQDERIRFAGFEIYSRPDNGEPLWRDKSSRAILKQSVILRVCRV